MATFAIKAAIDPRARTFQFTAQKTMYGGKHVATGDTIYLFASETNGGAGLVGRGIVTAARADLKIPGLARQTPRVSVAIRRTERATRPMGRAELRPFSNWGDGRPETELNFKLYRQATNKLIGISDAAARFLAGLF